MTDLDTDYIRDYHFDNLDVVPDNHYRTLERAIGIAADYLANLDEIVPIGNETVARNYIDLEIDCDLVDNLDYSYSGRDFLGN